MDGHLGSAPTPGQGHEPTRKGQKQRLREEETGLGAALGGDETGTCVLWSRCPNTKSPRSSAEVQVKGLGMSPESPTSFQNLAKTRGFLESFSRSSKLKKRFGAALKGFTFSGVF